MSEKYLKSIRNFSDIKAEDITFTPVDKKTVGSSTEYFSKPKFRSAESDPKKMPNVKFMGPPLYFPRGLFESKKKDDNAPVNSNEKVSSTFCARFGNDPYILEAFPDSIRKEWLSDCHAFRKFINKTLRDVTCDKFKASAKDFGIGNSEAKMFFTYPYELRSACIFNFKPNGSKAGDDLPNEEESYDKTWDMYVPPLDYTDEKTKVVSRCVITDPSGKHLTFDQIKGYDVWGMPVFQFQKIRSSAQTRSMMFKIVSLVVCKISPAKTNDAFSMTRKTIDNGKYASMFSLEKFESDMKSLPAVGASETHVDMDEDEENTDSAKVSKDSTKESKDLIDSSLSIDDSDLAPPTRSNARDIGSLLRKKK
jgi:hypothetical protein